MTPTSPSLVFTACTPMVMSPTQRVEKLAHCINSSIPAEIVYPSLGQVASTAQHISTFLDLYRVRAEDETMLNKVKSPTSYDGADAFAPLEEITEPRIRIAPRRRGTVRRSRSLSDLQHGIAITSDVIHVAGRAATLEDTTFTAPHSHDRSRSLTPLRSAQRSIVTADAQRIAEFRRRFGMRPRELRLASLPPPNAPLPSPPPPSALLKVKSPLPPTLVIPVPPKPTAYVALAAADRHAPLKSPRVPYWVKSSSHIAQPKTPRTMRSERRQGWGGVWPMGSIGQVVEQLQEA